MIGEIRFNKIIQNILVNLLNKFYHHKIMIFTVPGPCCSVAKSCPTFCDPVGCSPPGSCVREISQGRILERVAISFSKGSSWPRDRTRVSYIGRRVLYHWATSFCCCCSVAKSCLTLCKPMNCSMPGSPVLTISGSLLIFMSIELVMLSNHLILCQEAPLWLISFI